MSTITANNVTKVDGSPVLGWTLLSTTVASGDATIDITGLTSDYYMYKFFWYGVQPSDDATIFFVASTSTDNGSTFDAGGSDYEWANHEVSMATSPAHVVTGEEDNSAFAFHSVVSGNAANELSDFEITLFNPSATEYTKAVHSGLHISSTGVIRHTMGANARVDTTTVNAIQFKFTIGNIDLGTLKVYGVRA